MEKIKKIFLKFEVGDVEDPDMYANFAVESWSKSHPQAYQYLMEHSDGNVRIERREHDSVYYEGHAYSLSTRMTETDWAYYFMRFYKGDVS